MYSFLKAFLVLVKQQLLFFLR